MVRQSVDVPFGMAHFDLSYNLRLFFLDNVIALNRLYFREMSFFDGFGLPFYELEINTKLGHIFLEEYAKAPLQYCFST